MSFQMFVFMLPLWLPFLIWFWNRWSGRTRIWLNGRGRTWHNAFFFLGMGLPMGGLMLGIPLELMLSWIFPNEGPRISALVSFGIVLFGIYLVLWGPVPRFMLPAWIKERLNAGDPCQTSEPIPEVQHLMTLPQNMPDTSWHPTKSQMELPTTLRVNTRKWGISALLLLGVGAWLTTVAFNAQLGWYSFTNNGFMTILHYLVPLAALGGLALGLYYLLGFLRPQHLTLTEHGVTSRNFDLAWDDITGVYQTRNHTLLAVTPETHERYAHKNRWHTGTNGGFGGRPRNDNTLGLQTPMANPKQAFTVLQHLLYLRTGRLSYDEQPTEIPIKDA
ncbi:hypothetical protein [Zhihengliuella salsuginis]|nr:hypothetical protein [Zhihengliuella salsuginis]